ncbi:MAG: hypothetical protein JNM66_10350 [Bryobacterales bacterium]|nr:hypothetical protein [Bryobacterales bacterium]
MRERPNTATQLAQTSAATEPNDLYRTLKRTFDHLLQSEDPERYSLGSDCYVTNSVLEEQLISYCSSQSSAAAFLVGATGIGKSTILRHTFKINRSPAISSGTLFVPFSFNQRHISTETDMRNQMAAVFQEAVWLAKGSSKQYTEEDLINITIFVSETSPDLLNDPTLDLTLSDVDRMVALTKKPESAYPVSQVALKYFASRNPALDRIVLIIDDLEMKADELRRAAIINSLETRACLMNTAGRRRIPVILLIALRPETHIWASQLEQVSTTEFRELDFSEPVSLFDIFKTRFEAVYRHDDYAHLRDPSRNDDALNVLNAIGEALGNRYSTRFVRLNNYNLRTSLETFQYIVCNRRWLQKGQEWSPSFMVEQFNFAVSQAAVVRAMGVGDGEVYPQRRTCLVNLLYNTRAPSSDMLLLYILKYLQHSNHETALENRISESFARLLGSAFDEFVFNELMEYASLKGLIHRELTGTCVRLTLTPRAKELHAMLEESSLLLEMFRDDVWQTTPRGRPLKPTLSLWNFHDRFTAVALFITSLWDAETKLRLCFESNGASESGSSYFGMDFEADRMRTGFNRSVSSFYLPHGDPPEPVRLATERLSALVLPRDLQR